MEDAGAMPPEAQIAELMKKQKDELRRQDELAELQLSAKVSAMEAEEDERTVDEGSGDQESLRTK